MFRDQTISLETLFQNRIFHIPDYQRGYAWETKPQLEDFIKDLELLPIGRDHYTGTVVLYDNLETKSDQKGNLYHIYDVVDGQQRLTTTVLLLDAIQRELRQFESLQAMAVQLKANYVCVLDQVGQPNSKLKLNSDCHDFYFGRVLEQETYLGGPKISSHRRLDETKGYFADYLKQKQIDLETDYENWLREFAAKVRHHLKVLLHVISQEADVGVIFETMNNRGKDITELEKIKNYLLYLSSKLHLAEEHTQNLSKQIN